MQLVVFRMDKNLVFFESNESDAHVEQVIFVVFIHEEIENLVHQGNLHIPE